MALQSTSELVDSKFTANLQDCIDTDLGLMGIPCQLFSSLNTNSKKEGYHPFDQWLGFRFEQCLRYEINKFQQQIVDDSDKLRWAEMIWYDMIWLMLKYILLIGVISPETCRQIYQLARDSGGTAGASMWPCMVVQILGPHKSMIWLDGWSHCCPNGFTMDLATTHMVCRHAVEPACNCLLGWWDVMVQTFPHHVGLLWLHVMGLCASLGSITVYAAPMARLAAEQGHVGGFIFIWHIISQIESIQN